MKRKLIASVFVAGSILGLMTVDAGAAPITCPGGQDVVKTADGWDCQNHGDHLTHAENPKNPNADKNTF